MWTVVVKRGLSSWDGCMPTPPAPPGMAGLGIAGCYAAVVTVNSAMPLDPV